MYGLVDEAKGGIVGYFMDEAVAAAYCNALNKWNNPKGDRFWITPRLDQYQIATLLESAANALRD